MREIWSGVGGRTGVGRRTVAGPLWLVRRADTVGLLDEERVRFLSLGGVAVRVDEFDRIRRGEGRRAGRLTHRWGGQTGQHGDDEPRGQPSRNPHCVGTGAHSLAVVEGSGSAHRARVLISSRSPVADKGLKTPLAFIFMNAPFALGRQGMRLS